MGLGKAEIERCDWRAKRGRAPEPSWYWARGGKERVRNGGRRNQRNLWSTFRAGVERYRVWEGNAHRGERRAAREGLAGQWWILKDGLAGYLALGMATCPLVSLIVKNLI